MSVQEKVRKIIADKLSVDLDEVVPEASFVDDLGADSLDLVELIMSLEDEFKEEVGGEIPEADAEKLTTVGEVITYIQAKAGSHRWCRHWLWGVSSL